MAATPSGKGYWIVAKDGRLFAFGDAHSFGSKGASHPGRPVVGIAPTKDGRGYWLAASDGGVYSYGDAKFHGSLGGKRLDAPVVGIAATKSGRGYRMVASDGGIFDFGDARFFGSLGGQGLSDVVGMASTPSGKGYWILRRLGSSCSSVHSPPQPCPAVRNFGDAQDLRTFFGCGAPFMLCSLDFVGDPVVAIVANPIAQGYALLRSVWSDSSGAGLGGKAPGSG